MELLFLSVFSYDYKAVQKQIFLYKVSFKFYYEALAYRQQVFHASLSQV